MRTRLEKRPVVNLDIVDVIQMAEAAIELPQRETLGILRGTVSIRARRPVYHIYYIEVLQAGKRARWWVEYSAQRFAQLREQHAIRAIGYFHSHGEDAAPTPSLADLRELVDDPYDIGAIVWLRRHKSEDVPHGPRKIIIEQRPMHLKCSIAGFAIEIHFFMLRRGVRAIRWNRKGSAQYRRVVPRCHPTTKIRGEGVVLLRG